MKRLSATDAHVEKKRCAVYTRKSTTIGLEQEFNSLDAQREACLSYITKRTDWQPVEERYDDGGFTGANIDRPAFQRLLADVDGHRVDIVVVYKVDRLSRSLLDFVKVMERLTAGGASFVSVTQNFSTADAMGRLTLNMLMSFAEFEREMIAERTRDKICAARRKGKWTGGPIPFGYEVKNKHLVVNESEAAIVRETFDLFLDHRHPAVIAQFLNERGHLPRAPSGGARRHWTKATVARMVRNPIYAGQVKCGTELSSGEHAPIVTIEMHQRARTLIAEPRRDPLRAHPGNAAYVLKGLLRCARCTGALAPGSTRLHGQEYRYYRCAKRDRNGRGACEAKPISAPALEEHVIEQIGKARADTLRVGAQEAATWIEAVLANFAQAWLLLPLADRRRVLHVVVDRIVVDTSSGRIEMHLFDSKTRARRASEMNAGVAA